MDMVNDAYKNVGITLDSLMSSRAAVQGVSGAREAFSGALIAGTGVSSSNYSVVRDSCTPNVPSSHVSILDPHVSRTKGQKRGKEIVSGTGRMKSGLEIATKKNKRMCRTCNKLSRHDSRTCPLNLKWRTKDVVESSSDDVDVLMGEDDDHSED
ncbi:hypothetical protein Dimus_018849 [Dionaea muscipula]